MSTKAFKKKELKQAAVRIQNAVAEAVPLNPEAPFSDEFEAKMISVNKKAQKRQKCIKIRRTAAGFLIVALLSFAALFCVSTEVRANVIGWVGEWKDEYIFQIRFFGKKPKNLPKCKLKWLPEGMKKVGECYDNDSFIYMYSIKNGTDWMHLNVRLMYEGSKEEFNIVDGTFSTVTIADQTYNLITSELDKGIGYTLYWSDDVRGWFFSLMYVGESEDIDTVRSIVENMSVK